MRNGPKVGIVGSIDFPAPELVVAYVAGLPASAVVVSGGAKGVDSWAEEAAREHGLAVEVFHADWENLGRKAGPVRNGQIVCASDRIVAFWNGRSRGTLNTIVQAQRAGLPIEVFGPEGEEIPLEKALTVAEERGVVRGVEAAEK
ncbi:MAG TPA: DUF2493 domain-containing protein [Chromatiales bacterium]|nr:DUF2493 domain-containing protein [Chromatiales bacterium]